MSVSYTHLDVYKRQLYRGLKASITISSRVLIFHKLNWLYYILNYSPAVFSRVHTLLYLFMFYNKLLFRNIQCYMYFLKEKEIENFICPKVYYGTSVTPICIMVPFLRTCQLFKNFSEAPEFCL